MTDEWMPLSAAFEYLVALPRTPDRAFADLMEKLQAGDLVARARKLETRDVFRETNSNKINITLDTTFWRPFGEPDGGCHLKKDTMSDTVYSDDMVKHISNGNWTPRYLHCATNVEVYAIQLRQLWPTDVFETAAVGAPRPHQDQTVKTASRRRGPVANKLNSVISAMMSRGGFAAVKDMPEKTMAAEFGASRDTCRKARGLVEKSSSTISDK